MQRRSVLVLGPAMGLAAPLRAQTPRPRHAALALVGDRIEVVVARMATGHISDRNLRESWDDKAGSFDKIALAAMASAYERATGGAELTLLNLPPGPLHQRGDELVPGKTAQLPANLMAALQGAKVERLLLLTKHRADVKAPVSTGHVGIGKVRGIGIYLDYASKLLDETWRADFQGYMAPFVYVRLSLIDLANQSILAEQYATAMAMPDIDPRQRKADPWDDLDAQQKTAFLRQLLEDQLARMVPAVLEARR